MNDSRSVEGRGAVAAPPADPQRKKEEFRTWLFLSLIMAPILSVLIVSGYGFLVWMYQLFAGPPGS
ncbi:MAG TPA: periplasmic nitrate reductase, NapE protein [Burkholderiales bacterium]|nr:periplasmic nitrate reductase, NapE protein [Burkholderiales bacterium]